MQEPGEILPQSWRPAALPCFFFFPRAACSAGCILHNRTKPQHGSFPSLRRTPISCQLSLGITGMQPHRRKRGFFFFFFFWRKGDKGNLTGSAASHPPPAAVRAGWSRRLQRRSGNGDGEGGHKHGCLHPARSCSHLRFVLRGWGKRRVNGKK